MIKWLLEEPVTVAEVLEELKQKFNGCKVSLLSEDSFFYSDFILDKSTDYFSVADCKASALYYEISNDADRKILISTNVLATTEM